MSLQEEHANKRIMIFGRPGSGKSTFAYELHNITHIPLYHLDKYFFTSNWAKRDNDEFMRMQNEIVSTDLWIIDGNCTKSLETRYSRADLCLYLITLTLSAYGEFVNAYCKIVIT